MRSLRTQHSTSTSGSNRRVPPPRGSSSPAPLGHPLLPPLPVRPFSLTRRFLMPRSAACGSALPVDPLSLLLVFRLLSCVRLCACFPDRDCRRLPESLCIFHRSCSLVLRSLFLPGRPDVFSRSRLSGTSSPLLSSPTLLLVTSSRSDGRGFWRGSGSLSVQSLNVVRWMQEHWSVPPCIHV